MSLSRWVESPARRGAHASPLAMAALSCLLAAADVWSLPVLSWPPVVIGFWVLVLVCMVAYAWHGTRWFCRDCDRWTAPNGQFPQRRVWFLWMFHRMVAPVGIIAMLGVGWWVWSGPFPLWWSHLSWLWMAWQFRLSVVHQQSRPWCPWCPSMGEVLRAQSLLRREENE